MPDVGQTAPDFCLPSASGDVRLGNYVALGPVLVSFHFEDATPTCSTQIESLKDAYATLRNLGVDVIAISADGIEAHCAFAERLGGLPFALASDADLAVARAYDAVAEDDPRRSRRALFVINGDGIIRYAANPYSPNNLSAFEDALRALGLEL